MRVDKLNKKGYAPIILHISINGKRKKIALNELVPIECFDTNTQRVITHTKHKQITEDYIDYINAIITAAETKLRDIRMQARRNAQVLTVDTFLAMFQNQTDGHSFLEFCKIQIQEQKHDLHPHTHMHEKQMLAKLTTFSPVVTFAMINQQFIDKFSKYLTTKANLNINSAGGHLKKMRKYLLMAERYGHQLPKIKMNIKYVQTKKEWHNLDELNTLEKLYNRADIQPRHKTTLHFYLLACFTSLRISDKNKIIQQNINGNILTFIPQKTSGIGKQISILLPDIAMKYVNIQLRDCPQPYSNAKLNLYLKEIMIIAGITKTVTFHTARHTFAYNYIIANGDVLVLQKILGHSSLTTTMVYTHVDIENQKKNIAQLNQYYSNKTPNNAQS